jgi:DNA (cytosine-5)-methyltransferase 1
MKIISLFCGCGGMDLGLVKSEHKIVYANDNDKDSIDTYSNYFSKKYKTNKKHIVLGDISKIKSKLIPDADVVVGGFPCQGFSLANIFRNKKRSQEKNNNVLYNQMLRIIKDKKPKYFIAENVAGILSIGGYENDFDKKKREGKVMKKILFEMRGLGYRVVWKLLNAADYGTPQSRKRVIFLGTRKDLKNNLTHPNPTHSFEDNNLFLKKTKSLWETISDLENNIESKNILNHVGTKHLVKINGYIGNRLTIKNKLSPTIVGRGGGTGGPVIIPHPNKKRRLTVRETARLQSFPDNMKFYGSISSCYRQIGNAVPWQLAYNLGKQLKKLED